MPTMLKSKRTSINGNPGLAASNVIKGIFVADHAPMKMKTFIRLLPFSASLQPQGKPHTVGQPQQNPAEKRSGFLSGLRPYQYTLSFSMTGYHVLAAKNTSYRIYGARKLNR
jgi:hypothetical protein